MTEEQELDEAFNNGLKTGHSTYVEINWTVERLLKWVELNRTYLMRVSVKFPELERSRFTTREIANPKLSTEVQVLWQHFSDPTRSFSLTVQCQPEQVKA